jgi:hypothetical protein
VIVAVKLTDVERAMLAFERENTWWVHAGRRESAILDRFGISTTLYDRRLHVLIFRPEALEVDPVTVNRLRRRLASRRRGRSIRELGL